MSDTTTQQFKDGRRSMPQPGPEQGLAECMDQFSRTFEASARRWELVVYPSLVAFIVLAAYGFFLVYSLTDSVSRIADRMDAISIQIGYMESIAQHTGRMESIAANFSAVAGDLDRVAADMERVAVVIDEQSDTMIGMAGSMESMTAAMHLMRQDVATISWNIHNVSRPMNFMNNMVPW